MEGSSPIRAGRVYTVTVHVLADAGNPVDGATVDIAHDGLLSRMETLKTGADGRLRTEVRVGQVDPVISASRFPEYGCALQWTRRDNALRTWDHFVVLERNTEVHLNPVDASTGRSVTGFSGTLRCETPFRASPELEARWMAAEVRSRGGRGDETFAVDPGMDRRLWMAPCITDLEISATGYETARIRVEIPRQRPPFDLAVPLRPETA